MRFLSTITRVMFCGFPLFFSIGCLSSRTTTYNYINRSQDDIRVTISGFTPDATAGFVGAGAGKSRLSRVQATYWDTTAHVKDKIAIKWILESNQEKHQTQISRQEIGLLAQIRKGTVYFIYTAAGDWRIEYSRKQPSY